VAIGAVSPAAAEPAVEHGPSIFPLGLDKRVAEPETTRKG
jgi:hypothetical protein